MATTESLCLLQADGKTQGRKVTTAAVTEVCARLRELVHQLFVPGRTLKKASQRGRI
jgi:hypothetical protein